MELSAYTFFIYSSTCRMKCMVLLKLWHFQYCRTVELYCTYMVQTVFALCFPFYQVWPHVIFACGGNCIADKCHFAGSLEKHIQDVVPSVSPAKLRCATSSTYVKMWPTFMSQSIPFPSPALNMVSKNPSITCSRLNWNVWILIHYKLK